MRDIDSWMTANMLKMKRDQTEIVVLNAQLAIPHLHPWRQFRVVMRWTASQRSVATNMSVLYDTHMSIRNIIVTAACKAGFYHLRNISRIRKYISRHTAEMLSFSTSRLDFLNSLLYGLLKQTIKRLYHVQNVPARIVAPKHSLRNWRFCVA